MVNLTATTDKIQLITSSAADLDVIVSYVDLVGTTPSTATVTPGRQLTNITTAATTDILAAPAASTFRNVKEVTVRNVHAGVAVDVTVQLNANSVIYEIYKVTLAPGDTLEYVEGVGWYVLATNTATTLFKVLTADAVGQNVATAQPLFPTAGAVSVVPGTYRIDSVVAMTRTAGVTSHTTSLLFAGTATVGSIQYMAKVKSGDVETNAALNATVIRVATATVVKAASTSATEAISIDIEGIVRFTAAGTFIPQFIYSAAPGGAPTVRTNSFFSLYYLGDQGFSQSGTWS